MLISILIFGFIGSATLTEGLNQRTWTYEIISIETNSSNEDLLFFDLRKERVSRGVYSVSGKVVIYFDVYNNDGNTVSISNYRSALGDGNYKSLPFRVPPMDWISLMNTFYKNIIMESTKNCSDLPYTKNIFVAPLVRNEYTLTKCWVSADALPSHLEEGFYKIVFNGKGIVDWQGIFITEVKKIR